MSNKNPMTIARNILRVGLVNSIDPAKGTVKVLLPDKDDIVTTDIPMLSFEYHMPEVGDSVLCVFLGNGLEQGFCLGKYYSDINIPPEDNEKIYVKRIDENMEWRYNKESKELKLTVENVEIKVQNGTVIISADKILLGGLGANEGVPLGGTLKAWLDNHTHPTPNGESGPPTNKSPEPSEVTKIC